MKENVKIQLLIDVIKNQMERMTDQETISYITLKAVYDLAEGIKNENI
ncbi:hypothetical protein UFOVP19_25 [uncultured Caudovirales phage]|uniref:Uncharacterized protein n=1 Tax=uncultured Caudovirales phage TaxID=2100421 RepID=A0A6J5KLC2_9CAUD|nr:hypothetical protein UFOVP19_25 [uncultured Caudovirales phage]